jgi:hypothetical protein
VHKNMVIEYTHKKCLFQEGGVPNRLGHPGRGPKG